MWLSVDFEPFSKIRANRLNRFLCRQRDILAIDLCPVQPFPQLGGKLFRFLLAFFTLRKPIFLPFTSMVNEHPTPAYPFVVLRVRTCAPPFVDG